MPDHHTINIQYQPMSYAQLPCIRDIIFVPVFVHAYCVFGWKAI